jgi:YbbR domain-containing protein
MMMKVTSSSSLRRMLRMSDNSVKLRVSDLKKLMEWISSLEDKNYEVEINVSHSSGIGPSIEASVETVEGRGVWIDLSDYENW